MYTIPYVITEDSMVVDAICRVFVKSLRAGDDSVSVINLNPPYDLMVNLDKISRGRATRGAVEPNSNTLYQALMQFELLKSRSARLNKMVASLVKPEKASLVELLL